MALNTSALQRNKLNTSALTGRRGLFDLPESEIRQARIPLFEKVVSKLPQPVETFVRTIKEGLFGTGQETVGLPGQERQTFDTGFVGFFRPLGVGKPREQKVVDRMELLRPLVDEGKITQERADEIARDVLRRKPLEQIRDRVPVKEEEKLSLTPQEKQALRPVVIEETLDKVFGALDVISLGLLKPITRTAAQKIAQSKVANDIADVLMKEIPELKEDIAGKFGEILVPIDNADDVQKIINRTEFALQEARKAKGAVDTKALQPVKTEITPVDQFLTEKFGRTSETALSTQLREALIETRAALTGAEELIKKVGSPAKGFDISVLERKPDLRGGIKDGVLTDSFSMIIDKQITEDFFRKLFEKNARLAQKRHGFTDADVKKIVQADLDNARKEKFVDYKQIIPKIEDSKPAFIQGVFGDGRIIHSVLSDGKQQVIVDPNRLAFMKKSLPDAEIRIVGVDKPVLFVKGNTVKGLLMPIRFDGDAIPFDVTAKAPPTSRAPSRVQPKPAPKEQAKAKAKELKDTLQKTTPKKGGEPQTLNKARSDAVSQIEKEISSLPKPTIREALSQAEKSTPPPLADNTQTVQNDWRGTFKLPPETTFQAGRRAIEDFNIRLKVLNDKIEEMSGGRVEEHFNLWAQKDMLPRQQSDMLRRLRDEKRDFVERLVEARIGVEELDEYLHAKHAIERNKKMNELRAERNIEQQDGLSGMTDKEAREILSRDNSRFAPFEAEMRARIKRTLDFEVEQGLLKETEADVIRQAYKEYVPLYRDLGDDDYIGIGQGIDISGKEIKRAKGSEKRVTSPLGNIFFQEERARTRALKNAVGNTIIDLVKEHPFLKDLFEIEKQQYVPRFNKDGELQFLDPKFKFGDNVLGTKREGSQYFITVKDQKTAQALKNLNIARIPTAVQFARSALGIWSSFKTRWRPEFLLTNFERDLGEALVNLQVEKTFLQEKGKGLRVAVVKNLFPSQKEIWKYLRGGENPQADEFFKLGGDAGHFWLESYTQAEVSLLDLQKQIENVGLEKLKNPIRSAGKVVDDLNTMIELGIRFSSYKELVKRGMNKTKAINATADLTVNFSRQGELSPVLKAFYGFINPTIQGSSKIIRTLSTKEGRGVGRNRVIRAVVALAALGFITRTISIMLDPEGDEQINDWAKNHKLTFAIGGGKTVTLWSMPYGYTSFYSLGSNAAEMAFQKKNIREATASFGSATLTSFSPFEGLNDFIPTLAKPIFEINNNKGWYDGKIHPEQIFTKTPKPNAESYFESTSETSKFVAEFLQKMSGGGDGKAGVIDVHPDDLEYLYAQWFGGPFEFVSSSIESAARGAQGEFDVNRTPFVRQFYREQKVSQWSYRIIYDTLEDAYKKDISDTEKERFYRAVETGVNEEIFDQKRGNEFIQDFIKAQYKIVGSITDDETLSQVNLIPKEDREKLISTYAESTQIRISRGVQKTSTGKKSIEDILGRTSTTKRRSLEEILGRE